MKRLAITTLLAVFALLAILGASQPAVADDEGKAFRATLTGFEETPATLSSPGTGRFKARIHDHETMISFELHYEGLEGTVQQAHIHLGRPAITGGIVLFLCTNLGNAPATVPTPQACPAAPATISGTLTAADVVAQAGQGIAQRHVLGEEAEHLRAHQDAPCFFGFRDDAVARCAVQGYGLFDQHVLAGVQRGDGHPGVQRRRQAYIYEINRLVGQQIGNATIAGHAR